MTRWMAHNMLESPIITPLFIRMLVSLFRGLYITAWWCISYGICGRGVLLYKLVRLPSQSEGALTIVWNDISVSVLCGHLMFYIPYKRRWYMLLHDIVDDSSCLICFVPCFARIYLVMWLVLCVFNWWVVQLYQSIESLVRPRLASSRLWWVKRWNAKILSVFMGFSIHSNSVTIK